MLVIGADVHKSSHCLAAVCAATGELRSSETIVARAAGHRAALAWARRLGPQRVWAIEDCRHVSGSLERWLVDEGERVVRVAPRMTARTRRKSDRGKSDLIDALAVARAALQTGIDSLPAATVDEQAEEIRLWIDRRDDLVCDQTDDQRRLRWHLHRIDPALEAAIPAGGLGRAKHLERLGRKLAHSPQDARIIVCRELIGDLRRRARRIAEIEGSLAGLVAARAPQLTAEPGCGTLSAARIIAEIGDPTRFASDAQLARLAGVAPIPASSGRTDRWRLDRGGNRRLNCAIHRIAVTKGRVCPETQAYLARKQAEGKTRLDALRCLKRHLARRIWQLICNPNHSARALDIAPALT